jgi:excisionase family DNA binding protein
MPKQQPESSTNPVIPRLLRIQEAATYVGSTPWFIRSIIWSREIPFVKLGKRLLLDRCDLDHFVESQKER